MKKSIPIIITLLLISISTSAWQGNHCTIEIRNLSETTAINFWVYWTDHDIENYFLPINIIGGELKPEAKHISEHMYRHGKYFVQWRDANDCCVKYMAEFEIGFHTSKMVIGLAETEAYLILEILDA